MNLRSLFVASFLCLLLMILGPLAGSTQQVQPLEPEWLRQMYAKGWEKVQEGLLRRDAGGGEFETFSYGAEGLQWVIEGYAQDLAFFEERYNEAPSEDLAGLIEKVQGEIDKLSGILAAAPSAEAFDGSAMVECTEVNYGWETSAGPTESPRGVTATARAYYHTNCTGYTGDTFAYAFAEAIDPATGVHHVDIEDHALNQGTWLDSEATASQQGSAGCYSKASATVTLNNYSVLEAPVAEHYGCLLPVQATITGPATATADYYISNGCVNVTWTANATQGSPGYTYQWYIGTALQGTGSTLTKSYCNVSKSETVRVVATDIQGWTDDATFTTNIQYVGSLVATMIGPTSVTTDTSTPCRTVTWMAGASGAHPGYTYNWYIGTGTTVSGSGSTFTQQYCNISTAVTGKVVVRDSDGHTAEATKTTTITHTVTGSTPLTASISGPWQVEIQNSGDCRSILWTASAVGGAPGYTYTWYLGASTTAAGTGTTFTQTFCGARMIYIRMIARDSTGQTDDVMFYTEMCKPGGCRT